MKCQSLFSGKTEKNVISLSSSDFAQRVVTVKQYSMNFQSARLNMECLSNLANIDD